MRERVVVRVFFKLFNEEFAAECRDYADREVHQRDSDETIRHVRNEKLVASRKERVAHNHPRNEHRDENSDCLKKNEAEIEKERQHCRKKHRVAPKILKRPDVTDSVPLNYEYFAARSFLESTIPSLPKPVFIKYKPIAK